MEDRISDSEYCERCSIDLLGVCWKYRNKYFCRKCVIEQLIEDRTIELCGEEE